MYCIDTRMLQRTTDLFNVLFIGFMFLYINVILAGDESSTLFWQFKGQTIRIANYFMFTTNKWLGCTQMAILFLMQWRQIFITSANSLSMFLVLQVGSVIIPFNLMICKANLLLV